MSGAQPRPGIDAEFLAEPAAGPFVLVKGVSGAARGVQREHQRGGEVLAERVPLGHRRQPGHDRRGVAVPQGRARPVAERLKVLARGGGASAQTRSSYPPVRAKCIFWDDMVTAATAVMSCMFCSGGGLSRRRESYSAVAVLAWWRV